jgi:hypothetical protein
MISGIVDRLLTAAGSDVYKMLMVRNQIGQIEINFSSGNCSHSICSADCHHFLKSRSTELLSKWQAMNTKCVEHNR